MICASSTSSGTERTAPAGTPTSASIRSHSIAGRPVRHAAMMARSASWFCLRGAGSRKRGSLASSGRPSTPHSAANCASVLATTGEGRSAGREHSGRRRAAGGGIADRRGGQAAIDVSGQHRPHAGDGAIEHADVDRLRFSGAVALAQGGEDGDGRRETGQVVDKRRPGSAWRRLWRSGDRHDPGHRLDDVIVGRARRHRPVLAEARDRAVDDAGIDGADRLEAHAQAMRRAGSPVLDHHVDARGDLARDLHAAGILEVQRHRSLAGVAGQEGAAHAGGDQRRVATLARASSRPWTDARS